MNWFGRSSGYYLFWTGVVYTMVSIAFIALGIPVQIATICWLIVLTFPLLIPSVARYFNMDTVFGEGGLMWRKREIGEKVSKDINDTDNNVLKFPEVKELPRLKAVEPELDVTRPPYSLGINDAGNIQFTMRNDYGTTSLTMTDEGVVNLIEDLAHYIRHDYKIEIVKK